MMNNVTKNNIMKITFKFNKIMMIITIPKMAMIIKKVMISMLIAIVYNIVIFNIHKLVYKILQNKFKNKIKNKFNINNANRIKYNFGNNNKLKESLKQKKIAIIIIMQNNNLEKFQMM